MRKNSVYTKRNYCIGFYQSKEYNNVFQKNCPIRALVTTAHEILMITFGRRPFHLRCLHDQILQDQKDLHSTVWYSRVCHRAPRDFPRSRSCYISHISGSLGASPFLLRTLSPRSRLLFHIWDTSAYCRIGWLE